MGSRSNNEASSFRYVNVSAVPAIVDWGKKGAVTGAKDQGQCAVAATEGINQIKTGKLILLSEQELMDCDTSEDQGCNNGLMDDAFQLPLSWCSTCNTKKESSDAAKITGYEDVPANSESDF